MPCNDQQRQNPSPLYRRGDSQLIPIKKSKCLVLDGISAIKTMKHGVVLGVMEKGSVILNKWSRKPLWASDIASKTPRG